MIKKIIINPIILKKLFTYKTIEMCKSCKRYNIKATCPPHISTINYYKKVLPFYNNGIICYDNFKVKDKSKWKQYGKESSLAIHNYLLKFRDELFSKGHYYINIFGAGSCKLCEQCSIPCKQPSRSIIPLEATGINVIQLMDIYGEKIKFPIKDSLYRIGLILYD